jgi:Tfp pilus assembly protein PilW
VELLVTLVVGGVLLTATISALISHFQYSAQLEARNRLQDHWGRVNFLLDAEIAEADTITIDAVVCDNAASLMTLNVRSADGSNNTAAIRYAVNAAGDLVRCGPPVNTDGSLDFLGNADTSTLVPNAQLVVVLATNRNPTYTLTLTDPSSGVTYANQISGSRSRVRVIDQ